MPQIYAYRTEIKFDMLSKNTEEKFYKKCRKKLSRHLKRFLQTSDPEELHHLRVAFKKLNAMRFFLQRCKGGRSGENVLQPLKEIFKHAGQIRSAIINLQLMHKFRISCPVVKKEELKTVETQTESFMQAGDKYEELLKISGTYSFKDIKDRRILKVYNSQAEKLIVYVEKGRLHDCRKRIKALLYMHDAIDKKLAGKLKLDTAYLDKLQEIIGKWHDAVVIAELLTERGYNRAKYTGRPLREVDRVMRIIRSMTKDMRGKIFISRQ
jgi:CHAD domain-containing protein